MCVCIFDLCKGENPPQLILFHVLKSIGGKTSLQQPRTPTENSTNFGMMRNKGKTTFVRSMDIIHVCRMIQQKPTWTPLPL